MQKDSSAEIGLNAFSVACKGSEKNVAKDNTEHAPRRSSK
jgi:hypothetical protein